MEAGTKPPQSPHLTTDDLCSRWHCTPFTLSKKYRSLGLTPIRIGRRHLFRIDQVEDVERRQMTGRA